METRIKSNDVVLVEGVSGFDPTTEFTVESIIPSTVEPDSPERFFVYFKEIPKKWYKVRIESCKLAKDVSINARQFRKMNADQIVSAMNHYMCWDSDDPIVIDLKNEIKRRLCRS